jgi:DNA-binding CsgD family transcriptional regulator
MTRPAAVPEAWERAVTASPVPMLVVDIDSLTVLQANPSALDLWQRRADRPVDVGDHLRLEERHRELLDLVASGRIDGFDTHFASPVTATDAVTGPGSELRVWVRGVTPEDGAIRLAVLLVTEGGDIEQSVRLPVASPARMVAGATDAEWVVLWVTREVKEVLAYKQADFVGLPLLAIAHPDTAGDLVVSLTHAAAGDGSTVLQARLRRGNGEYATHQLVLCPRLGDDAGVTFLVLPEATDGPDPAVALQRRVWRMAGDAHAAALARDGAAAALAELSSRQWEIVTRLQRGERVPTIADTLYLSQGTVRNHLMAVFRKFGVHSQEDLLTRLRQQSDVSSSAS